MDIITDKTFKYGLEQLDCTSDEFLLLKQFYDITGDGTNATKDLIKNVGCIIQVNNFQIYKVLENTQIKAEDKIETT